ncbi:MAG: fructose-1,6-bisphosphatase [Lachnospiraceae bacterium]|nr:fructose-1,6-bisphosphatase [Lachnospiraceae bacterium]
MKDDTFLKFLSTNYPTIRSVITELINLHAIMNLPTGTEHFISDIHGEFEAFQHIMNNCSGVIREKVELLYGDTLSPEQKSQLCTLIYYPAAKLELEKSKRLQQSDIIEEEIQEQDILQESLQEERLLRLIELCKFLSSKYTRSKVRKAMPKEYSYIMDELLHAAPDEDTNQQQYHQQILKSIIQTKSGEDFIVELSNLIKVLAVDKLHVVGDIYDRGPGPDKVVNLLMKQHDVDLQWGNHDVLWMGATVGSEACIAAAIRNNVAAGNYDFLENGYGISLRPLALFAESQYPHEDSLDQSIMKAISMILFKLEGQIIRRNPCFHMEDRLLLEQIDYQKWELVINNKPYPLKSDDFATVDPASPEALTKEEREVMEHLRNSFLNSTLLHKHIRFLYRNGSMYKCHNQNLLYHGCIPLNADGSFANLKLNGKRLCGRALMDEFETIARRAYFGKSIERKQFDLDCMWYLWCGSLSPLFGRAKMTTFERMFINDPNTHKEEKNAYYHLCNEEEICSLILEEFGLSSQGGHIINGHVPVRVSEGETPVRAGGKLLFIDGGFCKAYQKQTGIAGYTLIYNSHGMRLLSHRPFWGVESAIHHNDDIITNSVLVETAQERIMVRDTDVGANLIDQIHILNNLLEAYRTGRIIPKDS